MTTLSRALVFALIAVAGVPSASFADDAGTDATPVAVDAGTGAAPSDDAAPVETATKDAVPPVDNAPAATPPATSLKAARTEVGEQSLAERLMGVLGCLVTLGLAFLMSSDRKRVSLRIVGIGVGLQLFFAVLVLKTAFGNLLFDVAARAVNKLLSFSVDGARFIFGNLVDVSVPVATSTGEPAAYVAQTGSLLAFGVLPSILFFSALTSVLYYLGFLQWVVSGMAFVMRRTMGTSGAESLSAAANIFVGQTEAPLLVRPYLDKMTSSELMAIMTGGFATVAGGVMAVYVGLLSSSFPDIAGHLLAASVMSAPASLVIAKIMVPETGKPATLGSVPLDDPGLFGPGALRSRAHRAASPEGAPVAAADGLESKDDDIAASGRSTNFLDAITIGTSQGLQLMLNVGAMLISFVALIALFNWGLGALGEVVGFSGLSLQKLLGWILAPLAFTLGVPWSDAVMVGGLMGTKTVLNEFVAYLDLAQALNTGQITSGKSVVIAIYALCGFSNFGSIGIQIGGLATMAPARRADLARLGFRAMIAASLACFQTAALAGMLL